MKGVILVGVIAGQMAAATASRAADVGLLEGGWVAEGVPCEALAEYSDERILKIDPQKVEFYEATCVIGDASRDGSTYRLELLCESEGETNRNTFEVALTSDDRLQVKDGFEYVRCN
jgi:hypothetical protein